MSVAAGQDINRIKRARGQGKPRGTMVVSRKKGKQLKQQIRKFNESTYTKFYVGSTVQMDEQKNIGHLDRKYTFPSVDSDHGTGWLFNIGACPLLWNPQTYGKIGNQVLPPNPDGASVGPNPFYLINGDNTGLYQNPEGIMITQSKLPETATPYNTADIPIQSVYTVPNTILSTIDLNLSFTTASVCDQLLTVQVVRCTAPEPIVPGEFSTPGNNGGISTDNMIKHLTNHRKNASGKLLEILYTYTTVLKGLVPGMKNPKTHFVKKKIKCNYLRSTCRRVSSATVNSTLCGQWKPTFEIDETGAQFNNCYVRAMSTCITKDVIVKKTVGEGANIGASQFTYDLPQLVNMSGSNSIAMGDETLKFARFRYGGTIGVGHYCKETSRGFGSATTIAVQELHSQLALLQEQVAVLNDIAAEHADETDTDADSVCTTDQSDDDNDGDHCDDDSDECDHCDEESDSDCGTGHQAGASPPGDGHTHPNNQTAEEHAAHCQHSH